MDGSELFAKCLEQATAVVKQVRDVDMANTTPCTEWNVRDLAGHMLYELAWVPEIIAGRTVDEVGNKYEGDLFDDDAQDMIVQWERAAARADRAVMEVDPEGTAHLSYGDVSVDDYLQEIGADLLVHAWDLAKGVGQPLRFDPAAAQAVFARTKPRRPALAESGLFGPAIDVPASADLQTKLLALFGRRADWRAN
jgi:uncharacterized protein (TIGR03086 family)